MSVLTVQGVRVGFGGPDEPEESQVLRGVDLTVQAGSVAALLGPSGCGKTTLLRSIAGFVRPRAGRIAVGSTLLSGPGAWLAPERRGIGVVPQDGALFGHLDVAGNVGFGLPRGQRRAGARIDELLELVGMAGFGRRRVGELSGGQQQRVALARALAPAPSLVLLDEPFSALDTGLRERVRADVRTALDAVGATAVVVTHDRDEALSFADTVAVIEAGRVAMHARPWQVYASPATLAVARCVGRSMEFEVTVRSGSSGPVARSPLGPVPVRVALPDRADGDGVLMLRPEQLRLRPADTDGRTGDDGPTRDDDHAGGALARVLGTAFHGAYWLARVALPGGHEVEVRGTGTPPDPGEARVAVHGHGLFYGGTTPATDPSTRTASAEDGLAATKADLPNDPTERHSRATLLAG